MQYAGTLAYIHAYYIHAYYLNLYVCRRAFLGIHTCVLPEPVMYAGLPLGRHGMAASRKRRVVIFCACGAIIYR